MPSDKKQQMKKTPLYSILLLMLGLCVQLTAFSQQHTEQMIEEAQQHEEEGNFLEAAKLYNKIAIGFQGNSNTQHQALEYFNRSLAINKRIGNKNAIRFIHIQLGSIYSDMNNHQKALNEFNQAHAISQQMNNKQYIMSDLLNLSLVLNRLHEYSKSENKLLSALELSKEANDIKQIAICYLRLSELYKLQGNSEKSFDYLTKYNTLKEHDHNKEIAEAETAYSNLIREKSLTDIELQKTGKQLKEKDLALRRVQDSMKIVEQEKKRKELELEIKELRISEQDVQLKNTIIIIASLAGVLVMVVIFSLFLLKLNKDKKRANKLLEEKNIQINKQKKHIEDSIEYAQTIQNALLPVKKRIDRYFDSFILYKPREVVSGDFYWYRILEEEKASQTFKAIIAVVDCTGHGVPGAFMSMIGSSLLNEIIIEKQITDPKKILDNMHKGIFSALKQSQTTNNDGMDATICYFEKKQDETKVLFAGAKQRILISRINKEKIEMLRGSRRGIGGSDAEESPVIFENQEFNLKTGETIYLMSDGYADQNNPQRERFGTLQLNELIEQNKNLAMQKQKEELENTLHSYMQDEMQRDDITVIGLKLKQ